MTREEAILLLAKASAAYPNKHPDFKESPQIFETWVQALQEGDAQTALQNLNQHVRKSNFFPDIADFLREPKFVEDSSKVLMLESAHVNAF